MNRERVGLWIAAYERAWRRAGTEELADLFSEDATYQQAPYAQPLHGLKAISTMWLKEREGPDEVFKMSTDILAVDANTAVVRVEVVYGQPVTREYRELWVLRFADDGKCAVFEEWPFWPKRPRTTREAPPSPSDPG